MPDTPNNCLNGIINFDETMIILSNDNSVNNGIMGYRSGQEAKDTSDLITLVE